MSAAWKTVRVFISSTFRDMHAERDQLVRFIFPRLREELLKRRIHLIDVDLRWGVTTEQDALAVCREVIDECRPRFLCILGGRYGWTPPGQTRSITADEIHYSALDKANAQGYHYFYFRDPTATVAMAEDTSGEFREPAGSDKELKIQELKQAVADAGFEPRIYPAAWSDAQQRLIELEEFGHRVYDDLLGSIDDEFGTEVAEQLDEFAEERSQMDAFMQERTERYVVGSRRAVLDELEAFTVSDGDPNVFVLSGTPGSGKSALLAKFCNDYVDSGGSSDSAIVLPHFIGASTGSTDLRRSLRRLCYELQSAISAADPAAKFEPVPEDVKELNQQFTLLLEQAAGLRRVVLIIDALNQMDGTDNANAMNWLPWQLPPNVRVIVSSLEHSALDALRKRGDRIREQALAPLGEADARAIIEGVLDRYRKRMSDEQITLLLSKTEADTPLYLLVALEELRTLGDYDEITQRIRELHGTTTELFLWILKDRLEQDPGFRDAEGNAIGAELVRTFVSCLGVSRHGLSHAELAGLIAPGDPEDDALGNVAALERLLRPYLMRRGELLGFFHGQLIEAVETEYLDEEFERIVAHRQLARYFHRQLNPSDAEPWSGDSTRALSELPYHQTAGAAWDDLEATLCDLRFIQRKCVAGMTFELVRDYNIALNTLPELRQEREQEQQRKERLRQYGRDLIAYSRSEGPLPNPPDTRPALESMRRAEDAMDNLDNAPNHDTRAALIQAFENFVSSNSHLMNRFPYQTVPFAFNHASTGPVTNQAENLVNSLTTVWLRRTARPPSLHKSLCVRSLQHAELVNAVALTPDGKTAVSATMGGTLSFWDVDNGELLRTIEGHAEDVMAVALTPDGNTAISVSRGETLRVWDIPSGELLWKLEGHTEGAYAVSLTPDGKTAVSAFKDGILGVWDVGSGQLLRTIEVGESIAVALTPDGKTALASNRDNTLQVWDIESGNLLRTLEGHTRAVGAVALTPDGNTAISVSRDETLRVWDIPSGEPLKTLKIGESIAVAVTPDAKMAISTSCDKSLQVWNIKNGELLRTLEGHTASVEAVALTPDGNTAVSASWDRTVRVWNVASGDKLKGMHQGYINSVNQVTLTRDGNTAVSAGGKPNILRVWDVSRGELLRTLEGHSGAVRAVALMPDGKTVVSASKDTTLRVWDITSGACLTTLGGHTDDVHAVSLTPDGKTVVSASKDDTLRVWDVATGEILRTLQVQGHTEGGSSLAISPDGKTALLSSRDNTLGVWDLDSGELLRTLVGHTLWVTAVALTPDGNTAISGSWDHKMHVWDIESGELLRTLEGHTNGVHAVTLTPDGKTAVSASKDTTLRVWDIERGELLRTLEGHTDYVHTVVLTPDGSTAISASWDGTLRVWCIANGALLYVYPVICWGVAVAAKTRLVAGLQGGQLHFLTLQNYP